MPDGVVRMTGATKMADRIKDLHDKVVLYRAKAALADTEQDRATLLALAAEAQGAIELLLSKQSARAR
jgi:hypothetical protein